MLWLKIQCYQRKWLLKYLVSCMNNLNSKTMKYTYSVTICKYYKYKVQHQPWETKSNNIWSMLKLSISYFRPMSLVWWYSSLSQQWKTELPQNLPRTIPLNQSSLSDRAQYVESYSLQIFHFFFRKSFFFLAEWYFSNCFPNFDSLFYTFGIFIMDFDKNPTRILFIWLL